jgi:nanoRNase/pAp phosphatase (c-di-AMP/oligoRNAs hydrolase)
MTVRISGDYSEEFNKFESIIKRDQNEISVVLAQLDPDAIGSAMLFKKIADHFGRTIQIYFAGPIDHPQNLCIFNQFELDKTFKRIKSLPENTDVALLDSCMVNDARIGMKIRPKFIIDHHMGIPPQESEWAFIESFGSCCTILVLMAQHFGIKFTADDAAVTTLGAIGIYNDTSGFIAHATTNHDMAAFQWLMEQEGNWDKLREVNSFEYPVEYYSIKKTILSNMKPVNTFLISSAGYLQKEHGVFLAIIADELVRRAGISTVITWAVISDFLIIKARSKDRSLRLDSFLKDKFGETSAGAKGGSGGANVSLGFLAPSKKNKESLLKTVEETIMDKLFDADGAGTK